jgi:hypothetical protein
MIPTNSATKREAPPKVSPTVSKQTPSLPLGDDDPAHLLGTGGPVIEDAKKDKHPGITLELERLGALYNELVSVLADAW